VINQNQTKLTSHNLS